MCPSVVATKTSVAVRNEASAAASPAAAAAYFCFAAYSSFFSLATSAFCHRLVSFSIIINALALGLVLSSGSARDGFYIVMKSVLIPAGLLSITMKSVPSWLLILFFVVAVGVLSVAY